jgi:anti-anti-sigma factor
MEITVNQVQGRVPVTVIQIHGDLDASSYEDLIAKAQEVYDAGARDILLDLSDMPHMSSAGLVALHRIAIMLRGEKRRDSESGWEDFRAIDRDIDKGFQQHIKLLNPQPTVDKVLNMVGFKKVFEVYTDLEEAIASF